MTRLTLFFLGLFFITSSYAQHYVGIQYSPEFSYRYLTAENSYYQIDRNNIEIGKYKSTKGFTYTYTNKIYSFNTGMGISKKGFTFRRSAFEYQDYFYATFTGSHSYRYFEIPMSFSYHGKRNPDRIVSPIIEAGIIHNFYLDKSTLLTITTDENEVVEEREDYRLKPYYLGGKLAFGLRFFIGSSFTFSFIPEYKSAFMGADKQEAKEKLYSLGLNLKLEYKISN